jgi:hypothetical protein
MARDGEGGRYYLILQGPPEGFKDQFIRAGALPDVEVISAMALKDQYLINLVSTLENVQTNQAIRIKRNDLRRLISLLLGKGAELGIDFFKKSQ